MVLLSFDISTGRENYEFAEYARITFADLITKTIDLYLRELPALY